MIKIPKFQAIPPAGFHDRIAYRPACSQVKSRLINGSTDHYLTMPDGEQIVLASLPPQATEQAHKTLNDWGLCKSQGEIVPILAPGSPLIQAPSIIDIEAIPPASVPWALVGIVGAVAVAIAFHIYRENSELRRFE
jgi:hypothetical protein